MKGNTAHAQTDGQRDRQSNRGITRQPIDCTHQSSATQTAHAQGMIVQEEQGEKNNTQIHE